MSILNALLRPDQLLIAVDAWAEDAMTQNPSVGAKLLLIPEHNLVLASRGSAQFFLKIYELCLQASFRADFTMEQLIAELGLVMNHLWPSYLQAAAEAGMTRDILHSELVLGDWSPKVGRMVATAYAKDAAGGPARVQPLEGGVASPGEPLRGRPDSFEFDDVLEAGRLRAAYLNKSVGRTVAGGGLLAAVLVEGRATISDVGPI